MKASELIELLKEEIHLHGDLSVRVLADDKIRDIGCVDIKRKNHYDLLQDSKELAIWLGW
ncbi:MAG: hypothetical protein KBD78_16985 [Oligoflexales bacterium]|nr:hypothetical protein [Oligoflexales bacterium]